jgi:hypothetical protein
MKYVVEMYSGAMIYISSFIKIGSAIQKLIRGIHRQTDRQTDRREIAEAYFYFFQNKESWLIKTDLKGMRYVVVD